MRKNGKHKNTKVRIKFPTGLLIISGVRIIRGIVKYTNVHTKKSLQIKTSNFNKNLLTIKYLIILYIFYDLPASAFRFYLI
jgi:hypothetical protein